MKQHAARRSARKNYPRDLEHHSAVEIKEEREDKEQWPRTHKDRFQRIRRNITKTKSIWPRVDTAKKMSKKEGSNKK